MTQCTVLNQCLILVCILVFLCYFVVLKGDRMNERGRVVGIGKNGCPGFNDSRICSNTINSHRLVHWTTVTLGWQMAEKLFAELNSGHFCRGENLNNTEFLLRSCKVVGIDTTAATSLLKSDQFRTDVMAKINYLKDNGLDHIPVFLVDGAHIIDGAATTGKFVTLFRQLEAETKLKYAQEDAGEATDAVIKSENPATECRPKSKAKPKQVKSTTAGDASKKARCTGSAAFVEPGPGISGRPVKRTKTTPPITPIASPSTSPPTATNSDFQRLCDEEVYCGV